MVKGRTILLVIPAVLFGGLVVGRLDRTNKSTVAADRELFAAKQRCLALGDKYAQDHTFPPSPAGSMNTSVLKVDYSQTAHSCIAIIQSDVANNRMSSVIDLVTSDVYGGHVCGVSSDCASRSAEIIKDDEAVYSKAIAGEIRPLGH